MSSAVAISLKREEGEEIPLFRFVKPVGIATAALLLVTLILGLSMRRNSKMLLPWHKRMAILTLLAALSHAILVFRA